MGRLFVTSILLLALTAPGKAQDNVFELKLSTWVSPGHPLSLSLLAWAKDIEAETGGTVKSTLLPFGQLGGAFEHYDMARDGIADFALINPGYEPGRFPVSGAAELPFLIGNAKGGSAAVDGWYRKYWDKEMKDVHVCFAIVHDPGTLHSRKKTLVPADINGMKVRSANGTMGAFVTLLYGINVTVAAPRVRESLELGAADGVTFPWGSTLLFGIDNEVKYHMDIQFYTTVHVWAMSKAKYGAMSDSQRSVVDRHCTTAWAEKIASPWAEFEYAGRLKLRAMRGREVYKITPQQTALWRKAAEPLRAEWAARVGAAGYDPDTVYNDLVAALKNGGALVE